MSLDIFGLKANDELHNGRYAVLFKLDSSKSQPYPIDYAGYVVEDTSSSQCKVLRAYGPSDAVEVPTAVQKVLEGESAQSSVLHKFDDFTHHGSLCSTFELHGPNLHSFLEDDDTLKSASWNRKVFRETLQALNGLHSIGFYHGNLIESSIVFTYPYLASASMEKTREFYRPKGSELETSTFVAFNDNGSGAYGTEENLSFKVKLQNLGQAKSYKHQSIQKDKKLPFSCPPPEMLMSGEVSDKTDIWALGILMANIISGAPAFTTLVGGRSQNKKEQLSETQRLLGALPSRYADGLGVHSSTSAHREALLSKIRSTRVEIAEIEAVNSVEAEKEDDVFSEQSLVQAADLLKKMMAYDPEERYSAKQALDHEFFKGF